MGHVRILATLLLHLVAAAAVGAVDETIQDGATGLDVVEATIAKINQAAIFGEDYNFFFRLAYVETRFGAINMFNGGIWNLRPSWFLETTQPQFETLHSRISAAFDIPWRSATYADLSRPLYSALASYIYLCKDAFDGQHCVYPQYLDDQADKWVTTYKPAEDASPDQYLELVKELDRLVKCTGKYILVMVMDGSGSISIPDFEIQKTILNDIFQSNEEGYSNKTVDLGVVTFSATTTISLQIESGKPMSEIVSIVSAIPRPGATTYTNLAIDQAVSMLHPYVEDTRPSVMVVLTDGISTNKQATVQAAQRAHETGLKAFGIGIGNYDRPELETIAGTTDRVFTTTTYSQLKEELLYKLNSETCKLPQAVPINGSAVDELGQGQRRYYVLNLPTEGVVLGTRNLQGRVAAYYSYSFQTPNSALHDGVIRDETFVANRGTAAKNFYYRTGQQVFIGVVGDLELNRYQLSSSQAEGCGLSGTLATDFDIGQVASLTLPGTLIWEHAMYFEARGVMAPTNSDYVDMAFGPNLLLTAGRRFSEYLAEVGEPTLVVKLSFYCSYGVSKDYAFHLNVTP